MTIRAEKSQFNALRRSFVHPPQTSISASPHERQPSKSIRTVSSRGQVSARSAHSRRSKATDPQATAAARAHHHRRGRAPCRYTSERELPHAVSTERVDSSEYYARTLL